MVSDKNELVLLFTVGETVFGSDTTLREQQHISYKSVYKVHLMCVECVF